MFPSDSRSSCRTPCFISHRGGVWRGFLFLRFNPPAHHPDELLHSQAMISCRTCTFSLHGRDYDVELALAVVQRTNPAATRLPFVPISALCAWTPEGITHEDLRRYALNYLSNQYGLDTKQRGVDVQRGMVQYGDPLRLRSLRARGRRAGSRRRETLEVQQAAPPRDGPVARGPVRALPCGVRQGAHPGLEPASVLPLPRVRVPGRR